MTASIGVDNFGAYDFSIRYIVDFKLLGMAEVLKDLAVLIGHGNFHLHSLLLASMESICFFFPNDMHNISARFMHRLLRPRLFSKLASMMYDENLRYAHRLSVCRRNMTSLQPVHG